MATGKVKYGVNWPANTEDLLIEFSMIRGGGFKTVGKQMYGLGLYEHYKKAMQIMWPEDDWHRWVEVCLRTASENMLCSWLGCSDSGKSFIAAKWALTEYWASPESTLVLVSSTDVRGLELRIWGAIKTLFNRARQRFPDLPGHPLDSLHAIADQQIDEEGETARALNRGIICIPCLQSGRYVGIKQYVGIKAPRLRQVNDECNMMGPTHLDALANFVGKDYKALFLFNPTDPLDPGGKVAEPLGGWEAFPEPQKTTVWKTKMLGGAAVNLVGSDSPNYDFSEDKYPYLIGRRKFAFVESHFGKDSLQYYSQCMGVMKTGILARRVITRDLCVANRAFDKAIWEGTPTTRIWALDAAYGGIGGDRCEFMWGEFGESEDGQQILRLNAPELVPVSIKVKTRTPEQQIAEWIKGRISILGIGPERGGYDSTGRGTLGNAFAKEFGTTTPLPIEFGGRPSARPVRHDLFIGEGVDRRLMRCDEHFYDFVSELWMMTRYIVECQQIRELPLSVMEEGQQREYGHHKKKVFVESKNDPKAKERMPRSPDEYDCFVTLCEVARRLGFQLSKLGVSKKEVDNQESWWEKDNQKQKDIYRRAVLVHG